MTKKLTTISISKKTHDILMSMGRKGEPFDDILIKLIEKAITKSPLQTGVGDPFGQSVATNYSTRTIGGGRADEDFRDATR